MNKYLLITTLCIGFTWGLLPAQADVQKMDFNLSTQKDNVDNMNKLIFLDARIKELEAEVDMLKKTKSTPKSFGSAYVTEDGKLKLKAEDGGKDWNWDGKTWYRDVCQPGLLK